MLSKIQVYLKCTYLASMNPPNAYRLHYSVSPEPSLAFRANFLDPLSSLPWSLKRAILKITFICMPSDALPPSLHAFLLLILYTQFDFKS